MKFFVFTTSLLVWIGLLLGVVSFAGTTDTVTATVTAANISVRVEDGTVAYGTLATSGTANTATLSQTQSAGNDGNATADLDAQGANSTNWTLGSAIASETFTHEISTDGGTLYDKLNNASYIGMKASQSAATTQTFDLKITVPSSTASFGQQSATVTIQASAI